MPPAPTREETLSPEFARRLFDQTVDLYKSADLKAQLILGANGTFVTVLTGLALSKGQDLAGILAVFGPETLGVLRSHGRLRLGSFAAAVLCLYSRILRKEEVEEEFARRRRRTT